MGRLLRQAERTSLRAQHLRLTRPKLKPLGKFFASPELDLGHQLRRESRRRPLHPTVAHIERRLNYHLGKTSASTKQGLWSRWVLWRISTSSHARAMMHPVSSLWPIPRSCYNHYDMAASPSGARAYGRALGLGLGSPQEVSRCESTARLDVSSNARASLLQNTRLSFTTNAPLGV
jgi:hypothetical protein